MTDRLPRMVDLFALADQLQKRNPSSRLGAAVKNAGRVQSCIADLSLAGTTLEALAQLEHQGNWAPPVHKTASEHALLANAVILYARATATGAQAGERGHTSVRKQLSPENKARHDRIISVRNSALAHVRSNELVSDELWHREIVFAVENPDGSWLPAAMTRRVQSNPTLAADLRELLSDAERVLKKTYHKRINYVATLLERTAGAADLFPTSLLDPIEVFGSEDEARRALGGHKPGGKLSGVVDR